MTLARRLAAEAIGTAMLLAVVVGSGIMAQRLAGGNAALALLANALATGAGLLALILALGPVCGAHFNPVVTLSEAWQGRLPASAVAPYLGAQVLGAFAGVAAAHGMFGIALFTAAQQVRGGPAQWWSEFVATFGLLGTIIGCARSRPQAAPLAVAAYIGAAYWFTASTSFANPAATLARAATDTFAGIRAADTPGFILAQLAGMAAATSLFGWLYSSENIDVPRPTAQYPARTARHTEPGQAGAE